MRLVLVALATAALLAVNWWLGSSAGAAAMRPEGVQAPRSVASVDSASAVRVVVVQPGDTLWAIAQQIAPEEDPRITIQVIRETNAMDGAGLQAGQRLVIPTSLG